MLPSTTQSLLTLARSSADFLDELCQLIAADAGVSVADIVSIHCGVVELTDRYDVDALVNADTLVVRLRTAPAAPSPVASASAVVSASGHKRGSVAAAGAAAQSSNGDGSQPASKRAKPGSSA